MGVELAEANAVSERALWQLKCTHSVRCTDLVSRLRCICGQVVCYFDLLSAMNAFRVNVKATGGRLREDSLNQYNGSIAHVMIYGPSCVHVT